MDFETLDGYFRGASAVAFCGGMRRRGGSPWDGTLLFAMNTYMTFTVYGGEAEEALEEARSS